MMILLRVTIAFLLLLLLPDWYIHRVYLKGLANWQKRLYWAPSLLLLALLGIFISAQETFHDYFGIYLIVVLCIAVTDG